MMCVVTLTVVASYGVLWHSFCLGFIPGHLALLWAHLPGSSLFTSFWFASMYWSGYLVEPIFSCLVHKTYGFCNSMNVC